MLHFSTIFSTDWLPPILIKESRQFVRSRLVIWVLCAELLALVAYSGVFLSRTPLWRDPSGTDDYLPQPGNAYLPMVALALTLALVAAAWDGLLRTAKEEDNQCHEMMTISGLTPWQHAWGKVASGWIFGLLVLSTGIPFLVLAYQMRGVSLMTLAQVITQLLAKVLILMPLGLLIAKLPLPWAVRVLGGAALLFGLGVWMPVGPWSYDSNEVVFFSGWIGQFQYWFYEGISGYHAGMNLIHFLVFGAWAALTILAFLRFHFAPSQPRRWRQARALMLLLHVAILGYWWWCFGNHAGHSGGNNAFLSLLLLQTSLTSLVFFVLALSGRPFIGNQIDEGIGTGLLWLMVPMVLVLSLFVWLNEGNQQGLSFLGGAAMVWIWPAMSAMAGLVIVKLAARWGRRIHPLLPGLLAAVLCPILLVWLANMMGSNGMRGLFVLTMLSLPVVVWFKLALAKSVPSTDSDMAVPTPESVSSVPPQSESASPIPVTLAESREPPVAKDSVPPSDAAAAESGDTGQQPHFADNWLTRPLASLDQINPVFLQELRQLLRSQTVFWLFWMMVATAIFCMLWIAHFELQSNYSQKENGCVFLIQLLRWHWLPVLVPPLLMLSRSIQETEEKDLLFATPLRADRIRLGKVGATVVVSLYLWLPLCLTRLMLAGELNETVGIGVPSDLFRFCLESGIKALTLSALAVAFAWSPLPGQLRRWIGGAVIVFLASPWLMDFFLQWMEGKDANAVWFDGAGHLVHKTGLSLWILQQLLFLALCPLAALASDWWRQCRDLRLWHWDNGLIVVFLGLLILEMSAQVRMTGFLIEHTLGISVLAAFLTLLASSKWEPRLDRNLVPARASCRGWRYGVRLLVTEARCLVSSPVVLWAMVPGIGLTMALPMIFAMSERYHDSNLILLPVNLAMLLPVVVPAVLFYRMAHGDARRRLSSEAIGASLFPRTLTVLPASLMLGFWTFLIGMIVVGILDERDKWTYLWRLRQDHGFLFLALQLFVWLVKLPALAMLALALAWAWRPRSPWGTRIWLAFGVVLIFLIASPVISHWVMHDNLEILTGYLHISETSEENPIKIANIIWAHGSKPSEWMAQVAFWMMVYVLSLVAIWACRQLAFRLLLWGFWALLLLAFGFNFWACLEGQPLAWNSMLWQAAALAISVVGLFMWPSVNKCK